MACLLVPLVEGVAVSAIKKIALRSGGDSPEKVQKIRENVSVLEKMLYGGSFLLAVEHFYHGELTVVPPFLTAMETPAETAVMLREMATNGVGMAILTTSVWALWLCAKAIKKRMRSQSGEENPCA